MANVDTDAILTRVREVLEGDVLAIRAVDAGRFTGSLPPGLTDGEASRRGVVGPRYDVRLTSIEPHPSRPPNGSTLGIYTISLEVVINRHVYLDRAIVDDNRDAYFAGLAVDDGDVIRQALEYPGNLIQVFATAAQTGLVGGALVWASSEVVRFEMPGQGPGLIESTHAFTGVVTVDR